ncbi:transposase [Nitrosomonas nitrosa]
MPGNRHSYRDPYINAVQTHIPEATQVFDHFYIIKLFN